MAEMFSVIPSPTVDFSPLPSLCRTCAVVGNSGRLRQSGSGKLIDSHHSVFRCVVQWSSQQMCLLIPLNLWNISEFFRMNKAVTRGFEKDVGNRTTHHFLYPESAVDVDHGVSLVLLPFKLRDIEWLTSALSTGKVKMYEHQVNSETNTYQWAAFIFLIHNYVYSGHIWGWKTEWRRTKTR